MSAHALLVLEPFTEAMRLVPTRVEGSWLCAVLLGPVLHAVPWSGDVMLACDLSSMLKILIN